MKMRPVEGGLDVPPGTTIEFKPGAYHIMLLGLRHKPDEGQRFPLTLTFAKAGTVKIDVLVEKVNSAAGMMHDQDMRNMDRGMH